MNLRPDCTVKTYDSHRRGKAHAARRPSLPPSAIFLILLHYLYTNRVTISLHPVEERGKMYTMCVHVRFVRGEIGSAFMKGSTGGPRL